MGVGQVRSSVVIIITMVCLTVCVTARSLLDWCVGRVLLRRACLLACVRAFVCVCACVCVWCSRSLQDFFTAFLKKLDRVYAAVSNEELSLPKKLQTVDSVCNQHITTQLQALVGSFDVSNFPPTSDAGYDRFNSAVASLDAFQLCCEGQLKEYAAKLFTSAKQNIDDR